MSNIFWVREASGTCTEGKVSLREPRKRAESSSEVPGASCSPNLGTRLGPAWPRVEADNLVSSTGRDQALNNLGLRVRIKILIWLLIF